MRTIRLWLYLAVGLLLGANLSLSHAETIQATNGGAAAKVYKYITGFTGISIVRRDTPDAACQAIAPYVKAVYPSSAFAHSMSGGCYFTYAPGWQASSVAGWSGGYVCPELQDGDTSNPATCAPVYTCPTGQNWTLSGTTCTRPDCVNGEVRNPSTGVCESPCASKAGQSSFSWMTYFKDSPPANVACSGGCQVYQTLNADDPSKPQNAGVYYYTATTKTVQMKTQFSGTSCTVGSTTPAAPDSNPPDKQPPEPPKKPVCAATEGVLTSSKGTVACVPTGTPSAEVPKVAVKKTTDTFSDGSQKITTETTTQVPSTGAKDINTSVQVTANSSGTAGQAGTPGTTGSGSASVTDSNGDGNGDSGGGDCDPKKDFCGGPGTGGLYQGGEKTVQGVLTEFSNGVKATPVGSAMTGFFTVNQGSGACPQWSVVVPYLNTTLDLGQYACNPTLLAALDLLGYALLAVVSFVAFKWAVL